MAQVVKRLPIIVLAGSDAQPAEVPAGLHRDAMLTGPKGTIRLQNGRCMAAELIDRIRASECFEEPWLMGPRDWYEQQVDCPLVPVEGSLAETLRQLIATTRQEIAGHRPFAVTTCDILPTADEFRQLLDKDYLPHADTMF